MFVCWARVVGSPACSSACEHNYIVICICLFSSVAVAALLKLPLVTSNAGIAEAACGAVQNLAADDTISAKLGAAGACAGGYPA